jgi:single-strand DNA-binding protein
MRDVNVCIITGNLAREPEVRVTSSGKAVANIVVAVNRGYYNGEDKGADFIPVTAWGATAEAIEKYLHKGDKVLVRGNMRVESYESDGQKRYKTFITAEQVQFITTRKNRNDGIPGDVLEGDALEAEGIGRDNEPEIEIPF